MPYTQVVTNEQGYMLFVTDGSVQSEDEFFEWCIGSVAKAKEQKQTRLLFDNRTFSLEISQYDVLKVGERLLGVDAQALGLRFAVLSSKESPEISRFIETSFTNRSAAYKRFDSHKDALEWLLARNSASR